MSDVYSNYSGGYDDLYDDVMEEAGYDAWGIEGEEFGVDEETYLFEFDPFVAYDFDKVESDVGTMTYQSLMKLTEMTHQLLRVWKKRSSDEQDVKTTHDDPFNSLGLNLYQLVDPKERAELKTYSVAKLLHIFGSNEAVSKFEEEVNQMMKFLRKCFLDILARCLPSALPYPVLSTILSHLQAAKGLHNVGLVTKLECSKMMEKEYMGKLYLGMASVYDHLKVVMFNIQLNTDSTELLLFYRNGLLARFSLLVELVNSFNIECGLDPFEIESKIEINPGGGLETLGKLKLVSEIETNPGGGLKMFGKLGQAGGDGKLFVGHSDLELIKKIVKEDENQEAGQEYPELDEKGVELNKENDTGKESLVKGGQEEENQIEL
eukprot:GFUD01022532.1.p1 GENE.GFUD01022532.1~~GFUD01022532.1.p1  ORF type:complete len:377 (+),score=118.08 GFUD01022532.1:118-1248(+)